MHERLHKHMHTTKCIKIIDALLKCHEERTYAKFFGACNDMKRALNACLAEEYIERRRRSMEDSIIRKYNLRVLIEKGEDGGKIT